jgi:hypothetical protein
MLVLFKDNINIINLKQALYSLSKRNKDAIDGILNLIYKDSFIEKVLLS